MKDFEQWGSFQGRLWKEEVNVRDFIQNNYTQYDGETVAGSRVLSAIKLAKDADVAVCVNNGVSEYSYIFDGLSSSATSFSVTGLTRKTTFSEDMANAKNATSTYYIAPAANFIGKVVRDPNTNQITGLIFNPATTVTTP